MPFMQAVLRPSSFVPTLRQCQRRVRRDATTRLHRRRLCSVADPPLLPVLTRALAHSENTAVVSASGQYTYQEIIDDSAHLADVLRSAGPKGDAQADELAVELLRNEAEGKASPSLEHVAALIPRGVDDLSERRVAFMCPPDAPYVVALWAIWRAGGVTVPLCTAHPAEELRYVLRDSGADLLVIHPMYAELLEPLAEELGINTVNYVDAMRNAPAPVLPHSKRIPRDRRDAPVFLDLDRWAHIVYTSGTTGRPKGVVHTHAAIEAQVVDLVDAWGWRSDDRILHFLPLHHTHGIINKLCCPLWAGATVEFLPQYSAEAVWERLSLGVGDVLEKPWISVLMGVPTVYAQLIEAYEQMEREGDAAGMAAARAGCRATRLMVSGSAALPMSVLEKWERISGTVLLERYGMTEFAMALSNPLDEQARMPGYVGTPLRSVNVAICEPQAGDMEPGTTAVHRRVASGEAGELRVKGPGVFNKCVPAISLLAGTHCSCAQHTGQLNPKATTFHLPRYLNHPDATKEAFDEAGWFLTGDIARYDPCAGVDAGGAGIGGYKILGRASVDIIKSAGYKLSALEIERSILEHEAVRALPRICLTKVAEVSVVGVPDEMWGQAVCALVRLRADATKDRASDGERPYVESNDLEWLRTWLKERVAPYRVPSRMLEVDAIPKNVMGKVNKKAIAAEFFT